MCGIVGYIGEENSIPILLEGLKKLEYRGYDSAGLALTGGDKLKLIKTKGNLKNLEDRVAKEDYFSNAGIGHTRWATHGIPSVENAHPHICCASNIAVVHNGILENYRELKSGLLGRGHKFASETDTEVLAHLIEEDLKTTSSFAEAVALSLQKVKGSYAIAVINSSNPDEIITARKDSPLVIGFSDQGNFIASDIPAILKKTRKIKILEDNEMAIVKKDSVQIFNKGEKVNKEFASIAWNIEAAEKGGYEDFMLKEIFEQPKSLRDTLRAYLKEDEINFSSLKSLNKELKCFKRIFIIACGSSYHAAWIGKLAIEKWTKIPTEIDIGSEFRYKFPNIDKNTLFIAITQSGETADTLAGVKEALKRGHKVLAITNVLGSTVTREASASLLTRAGPEIGVAATKTFATQLIALYLVGLKIAKEKATLKNDEYEAIIKGIKNVPLMVEKILESANHIKNLANDYKTKDNFLYLGRGYGFPVALEGALKLKEISYIHAEGCAAGEMKHGPIALIDEKCPVVAIANKNNTYSKMCANIEEVKARGADVIAVISEGDTQLKKYLKKTIEIPNVLDELSSIASIIPLQLLAYYIAKAKDLNVDQPRNLAKSVTVE